MKDYKKQELSEMSITAVKILYTGMRMLLLTNILRYAGSLRIYNSQNISCRLYRAVHGYVY